MVLKTISRIDDGTVTLFISNMRLNRNTSAIFGNKNSDARKLPGCDDCMRLR